MRSQTRSILVPVGLFLASGLVSAEALMIDDPMPQQVDFQLIDPPVAPAQIPAISDVRPSGLSGSTVAALADGALVLDGDSGQLLRLDRFNAVRDRLDIGPYAAQLLLEAGGARAYVSDRMGDRVAVVDLRGGTLRIERTIATRAEPYGLALTPAGSGGRDPLLLVTTVADRQLSAYRAATGEELWSIEIGPEPRGVAIAPEGDRAVVTFLQTAAVARLVLRYDQPPVVRFTALDRQNPVSNDGFSMFPQLARTFTNISARPDRGQSLARAAFSALYLRGGLIVVPHQESKPHQTDQREDAGTYGGGGMGPVEHRLSFITDRANPGSAEGRLGQAAIGLHQPRAMAYDERSDILYLSGYGSDEAMALVDASTPAVRVAWRTALPSGCGPSGMAVNAAGAVLVYCELTRTLSKLENLPDMSNAMVEASDELSRSRLSLAAQRGRSLFRQGNNSATSRFGLLACSSCHPEARTDGLSWRIQGQNLQTPLLGGRVVGTHPFKWDGGDKSLEESLRHTVTRLGGDGISGRQALDLQAFLESLPRPRAPRARDQTAVARGQALFRSDRTGCAECHGGAQLTDRKLHGLARDLEHVDTPSLIGLAVSAPYYHDGSAATLRAVLMENGTIHGMGNTDGLRSGEMSDLIAYLETL